MNKYNELRNRQQKEIDAFPFMWAFNQKQFDEGMRKLGLEPTDTDKIYSIGAGGYIRKTDSEALHEMLSRHGKEQDDAIAADKDGEGFIYDMFAYELDNHEFSYTGRLDETLDSLGLTAEEIKQDPRLYHGLEKAVKRRMKISMSYLLD